ncbi:predicted protein [Naegleria gruberi]|uniref:Predicted protein n=1 Tax=Naegleria gruberi TaxID=5762 RepID=D2V8E6_NAEGR|nr:uncharacterized protein NAEGRDRAFT_65130 [Naegleria gruberi]EFC47030.1 predicted protein [Naegleria gruberi]|eukprot:XP_002679774.1 predicted protein [Naegleria gruberi strain NEG-M]
MSLNEAIYYSCENAEKETSSQPTKTKQQERLQDLKAFDAECHYRNNNSSHHHEEISKGFITLDSSLLIKYNNNNNNNKCIVGEIISEEEQEGVTITLIDFSNNIEVDVFEKLVSKMRTRNVGFSNQFIHVHTLMDLGEVVTTGHGPYNWPYGVAISHKCKCILISDQYSNNISIFDLESKKLKTKLTTLFDPGCLCIESGKSERDDDSLIVSSCKNRVIYKWNNLESVVIKSINKERMPPFVWKQGDFGTPRGITIRYEKQSSFNTIFVCDNTKHNVTLLNSETGQILRAISKLDGIYFGEPFGIALNNYGDLIVSEKYFNRVQILYLDSNSGEWISKIKFGSKEGTLKCPSGLLFDRVREQIIVCDQENQRISIYKENGELLTTFGTFGVCKSSKDPNLLNYPTTVCLDEKSGELFVVDSWNIRVLVFK